MKFRDCFLAAFAAAVLPLWAADAIPVQVFFDKPAISEAVISPTGRQVAIVAANKEGHNQLVVVDTSSFRPFVAAASKTLDVADVHWVNDKRLVYSLADPDRKLRDWSAPAGLFAVDANGADVRALTMPPQIFNSASSSWRPPFFMDTTWLQDSDDILALYPEFDSHNELNHLKAGKVDTRSGRSTLFEMPAARPFRWFVGPGDVPRVVVARDQGSQGSTYYEDPATHKWEKIASTDFVTGQGAFQVVGYEGTDTLYVLRRPAGTDYEGLYTYNPKTRAFSAQPIVDAKGFDLTARLIREKDRIVGLRYRTDAESTVWFDAGLKKTQARIDALLPGTVNRVSVPVRSETPMLLVYAFSDSEPGRYLVYDSKADKLTELGRARPDIDAKRMARRDFVRFKARDGMEVPAWVTVPNDGRKGPHPAVVLVHGGPWLRGGAWRWDADSQFLASRGYVVVEPEFRGSTGYGRKLFTAGWKQWGLAMQDDVTDATRWAIDKGIADPKRICIAGASYGGYATLMGMVREPDLYRCGVDWVGVTDIDLLYSVHWSDSSEEYKEYGMPVLVGDREKDAEQFKATSPIRQAARITRPLLMAYGGRDLRVPIEHGTQFRDAVLKTNPDVEWVVYADEGHGWTELKNKVDWWTRVEKFLARNIGQ